MLTRSQSRKTPSEGNIHTTAEPQPRQSRSMTSSSASTIRARKAAAEAIARRRQLERELQLAEEEIQRKRQLAEEEIQRKRQLAEEEMQRKRQLADEERQRKRQLADEERQHKQQLLAMKNKMEERELQAELAAIEAEGSRSSRRSHCNGSVSSLRSNRTEAWVQNAVRNSQCSLQHHPTITKLSETGAQLQPPLTHVGNDHPHSYPFTTNQPIQATNASEGAARIPPHIPTVDDNVLCVSDSNKLLQAVADTAAAAKALATTRHQPTKHIELTPFAGETSKWLQFKRLFDTTKAFFSPLENVARLQQSLRGAAREAVGALLISASEPEEILSVLEQNFARPEMIIFKEVAALKSLPRLGNDLRELCTFATKVRNSVHTIRMLDHNEYLFSPELFHTILGKLNPTVKMRWTDFAADNCSRDQPKLELLSAFLMRELDRHVRFGLTPEHAAGSPVASSSHDKQRREYVHTVSPQQKHVNSSINKTSTEVNKTNCLFCKKEHSIKTCPNFKALSIEKRWLWQREAKVCYRCLRSSPHTWRTCKVNPCGVDGCTLHHHPLLHGAQWPTPVNHTSDVALQEPSTASAECEAVVVSTTSTKAWDDNSSGRITLPSRPSTLLKIIPVTVFGPLGSHDTYALLDDGSTATLMDASVAARIGAVGPRQKICVNGVGGLTKNVDVTYIDFKIKGKFTQDVFEVKRAKSLPSLSLHTQTVTKQNVAVYKHLHDLTELLVYEKATPMVLIGAEHWHLSINRAVRKGTRNQPVACLTLLGWTLYGLSSKNSTNCIQFVNHTTFIDQELATKNENLETLIKEHYKLDSLGISKHETILNKQDKRAVEILESTTSRLPTGRFQVGLPWRDDITQIPDSYPQALSRLLSLERRMRREPVFAEAYIKFMNNMFEKGYAEECSSETYYSQNLQNSKTYRLYLPHFGIFHPQKRKLRVVHDAAAMNQGVSLNSLLLQGPDLLQNLLHILFRFREGRVALTADVKEMFPQIRIRPEDRDALRFLWRGGDQKQPIKEYRMTSVIFGASSSPFTALYIKNKNAMEHEHNFPNAAKAIVEDHYMDDYLGSHDSTTTAAQIAKDIVTVHSFAHFEMRGWVSNDDAALKLIPSELCAEKPSQVDIGNSPTTIRALGIIWDPLSDTLGFRTGLGETIPQQLTKRIAISHIMRVYDPLGLLNPVVVKGRILFQDIWRSNIGWDSNLSPTETLKWMEWFQELSAISTIKIPRWYAKASDEEPLHRELHVFADASEAAYACVAFWRLVYANGSVKMALVGSKARVTPLKPISIPRLELMAALIATRLAVTIKESHVKKPSNTFFWTDSLTVLGWLRSDARTFKPFVAHRIGEITENSNISDWRWVPTGMNVADDATRARSVQLDQHSRWFNGPSFLFLSPEDWPKEPVSELPSLQTQVELKRAPCEMVGVLTERISPPSAVTVDSSRCSSWLRLVRATARVHQAAFMFRQLIQNSSSSYRDRSQPSQRTSTTATLVKITPNFMKAAERHLLLKTQLESFGIEFKNILNSKPLPRTSRLTKLSPFVGEDKLLRLGGRIRAAEDVSQSVKTPVLLDGCHPIVRLLVHHYHVKMGHANHETVINELRQRYWLLRLRNTVRSVAHRCLMCRIRKTLPQTPPTGDLPPQRMAHHQRCFTFTGLDYFGPIDVSIGRRREKRYVALFTCMTSRAVHLELVHSLSADSAISSIRRFIARRGAPTTIFSDNGTAFVGANRILREFYQSSVEDFTTNHGIGWAFIPPAAPNFGGCWERLVRSVKVALSATLRERAPKEETLLTLLLEAEAVVNSRPLTHISQDPEDPETLTPFHFLIGSSSTTSLPARFDNSVLFGRAEWKKALRLSELFWSRWVKEVLPTMQPRDRPHRHTTDQISVGDVVLVVDGNLPRGVWPRGVIAATYPGHDGVVRVVDVSTMAGTLRRPLTKLVKLDTSSD